MAVPSKGSGEGSEWGRPSVPLSLGCTETMVSPTVAIPLPAPLSSRRPALLPSLSPPSLPFGVFPAGRRWLLVPVTRWLQLLMLFRKAPNPMLLFT